MHEFVVARLLDVPKQHSSQKAYWAAVGKATKIPPKTIEKIARRQIVDPGVTGIETLAEHFGYTPRRAAALARRQPAQAAAG